MNVMIDICVIPLGSGTSVRDQVVECHKIIRDSGLSFQLHGYGTNIEGDWDEVFAVVKKCHEVLHQSGVARVSSSLRVGTRTDKQQTITDKVEAVEERFERS